jgi:hypothetical protein
MTKFTRRKMTQAGIFGTGFLGVGFSRLVVGVLD